MADGTQQPAALNPWFPTTDLLALAILGKALEETGEATSALARCLIQGIDESEPVTAKPNREWLEDELADNAATFAYVVRHFGLNEDRMNARADAKMAHLERWHGLIRAHLKAQAAHPTAMTEAGAIVTAGGSRLVDQFMAEGDYPSSTPYPVILRDFAAFAVTRLRERVTPAPAPDATVVAFPGKGA